MTIKRSYRHLFMGAVSVALVLANCTVKEDDDESCEKGDVHQCDCSGNVKGHQDCQSDGTFGDCECPSGSAGSGNTSGSNTGGSGEDDGGATGGGTGGTSSGGTGGTAGASEAGANAGGVPSEGGADGAGGEPPFEFESCTECLETLCATEFEECAANSTCEDQYGRIAECIENDRATGVNGTNVTRDRLRGCGVTIGASANSNLVGDWAPEQMADETTNLINCLATSSSELPDDEWANVSGSNYQPTIKPWPADSCAKLACTSPEPQ